MCFSRVSPAAASLRDVAQAGVRVPLLGEGGERGGGELLAPLVELARLAPCDPVPRPCRRLAGCVRARQRPATCVMPADSVVGWHEVTLSALRLSQMT